MTYRELIGRLFDEYVPLNIDDEIEIYDRYAERPFKLRGVSSNSDGFKIMADLDLSDPEPKTPWEREGIDSPIATIEDAYYYYNGLKKVAVLDEYEDEIECDSLEEFFRLYKERMEKPQKKF